MTSLGLPGCFLYTDLVAMLAASTNVQGVASLAVPIPANPILAGAVLYSQWAVTDPRVNPAFPIATSDGLRIQLARSNVPVLRMSTVAHPTSGTTTTGFRSVGLGHVVEITWN